MLRRFPWVLLGIFLLALLLTGKVSSGLSAPAPPTAAVDAASLRGKVLCGYQGWFRCPGDPSGLGWVHWSRNGQRLTPETVCFEMWPDLTDFPAEERFAAPGFTYPDGRQASLFSSDNAATVLRHFEWMRDYGIDGVWLQHFLVDLPGGPQPRRYPSRLRVLEHVRAAARTTGRVWALSYDIAGMPADRIFDVLTADWKKRVDQQDTRDPRYLHQDGRPVVQVWGFYRHEPNNRMSPDLGHRIIDFFKKPGPYAAFLVGGGDWNWRRNPDPRWQALYRRFDGYVPWNVGNFWKEPSGIKHATTDYWAEDRRTCADRGTLWLPSVYPGFSWDNLKRQAPGTSTIPRRHGRFLWEQFHELGRLGVDSAYVAMFDEVDEGTAIFKVSSTPPAQAHFLGDEGLPSDWYLRLVGEGTRMLRGQRPLTRDIPIQP
ncbi:MAG: hypothetical protein JO112_04685 [Planctomycetes bacterium]|nr:hypothetical protein [Planctomycetota bacterium]